MAYIFPLLSKPDKTDNFSGILQVAVDIGQLLFWPSDIVFQWLYLSKLQFYIILVNLFFPH